MLFLNYVVDKKAENYIWSSYKGFMMDDLVLIGDEGRGKLR